MAKNLMEFVGTFVLLAAIILTSVEPGAAEFAPFAIGLALAAMIYAGAHVSGAHYNPAVTISIRLNGSCETAEVLPFMIYQVLGGACGALTAIWLKGEAVIEPLTVSAVPAVAAEFIFTLLLAFVILHVGFARATKGNSYFGVAIAAVVVFGIIAVGSISGALLNPAVTIALFAVGIVPINLLVPYFVIQMAAGAVATALFKITNSAEPPLAETTPQPASYLERLKVNS